MKNRKIAVRRCALCLVWMVAATGHSVIAAAREPRPNVVLILADDLGYGDVQALNPRRGLIPTPHIDRLIAEGLTFTDAHSASSVCTPTRYALLTGRYGWRSRLQSGVSVGGSPCLISPGQLTIAKLLQDRGYHTAISGKWHLDYEYIDPQTGEVVTPELDKNERRTADVPIGTKLRDGPLTRGFDEFFGFHHARSMGTLVTGDTVAAEIDAIDSLPKTTQFCVDFIRRRAAEAKSGKPFLLYFAMGAPHTPLVPQKQWQGKTGLGDYADFVAQTDDSIGQVIAAIEESGLAKDTLLVFTSDNGMSPAAGLEQLEARGHFPSADLRGYKADLWEGGHRVPLVVRWPGGGVASGATSDHTICQVDLLRTVADLLGVDVPANQAPDSISFLSVLNGETPVPRTAVVHHSASGHFAIRAGDWKLLLAHGSGGIWTAPGEEAAKAQGWPHVQLYNLRTDLGEQRNLYREHPERVAELLNKLETFVADGRSTPGPPLENDTAINLWKSR